MVCPKCGCEREVIPVIREPGEIDRILRHLVKQGRPPGFNPVSLDSFFLSHLPLGRYTTLFSRPCLVFVCIMHPKSPMFFSWSRKKSATSRFGRAICAGFLPKSFDFSGCGLALLD